MQIFLTGASGFVGSAVAKELVGAGHRVRGMVRSDAGAAAIEALGAQVHRGNLTDLDSLRRGAADADVVVHTAFVHEGMSGPTSFQDACAIDIRAIDALGAVLAGSNRQLVVTSGTPFVPGRPSVESDPAPAAFPRKSEPMALAFEPRGVRVAILRLPRCVHAPGGPYGFGSALIAIAEKTGVSAYVGEQRWCAVHRDDAARLYRTVVERGATGSFHAVGEGSIAQRAIAEAIGARLGVPVIAKPPEHFGPFAMFSQIDSPTSAQVTQEKMGWTPTGSGLLADLMQRSA